MPLFYSLIGETPYIELPQSMLGWFGWFFMLVLLAWGIRSWWESPKLIRSTRWWVFVVLLMITPITSLMVALQIPGLESLPLPNIPGETAVPSMILLFMVPGILAAGMVGILPAVIIGCVSGLFLAFWKTHTLFSVIETAGILLLFAVLVRQTYRTRFFKLLRHPLWTGIFTSLISLPILMMGVFFATTGSLAVRLDYALSQAWMILLMRVAELILAGIIGEIIFLFGKGIWFRPKALRPSPVESSLQWRFLFTSAPFVIVGIAILILSDWWVAGAAARQVIRDRLKGTAEVAVESLPYFLETGQNLIINLAQPELLTIENGQLYSRLGENIRAVPFFRELVVFDGSGNWRNSYPTQDAEQLHLSTLETNGIQLAMKGVLIQTYTTPPNPGESSAQISFLAAIRDQQGLVNGVLLGRTDMNSNPFTQPAIKALEAVHNNGGDGIIIDENQRILFHTMSGNDLVMTQYGGRIPADAEFFDDMAPTGTRQIVYYQPSLGRPWAVIISVPAEQAQDLSLRIAIPLLLILAVFTLIAFFALRVLLSSLTASLRRLVEQASKIARGQLDSPMPVEGVDEVGQLSSAFEQMRIGLRNRLDELNRLLVVSESVAEHLEIEQAVNPILQAALGGDASAARIVLIREVLMEPPGNSLISYGTGRASSAYSHLDAQLFDLGKQQEPILIPNFHRGRRLSIQPGVGHPGSIIALPLYHEEQYYGVLWVAFDAPQNFSDEQIRFLTTLAGEASIAAANSRLYVTAEIGRQRLVAVLASTPEPVLVFDEKERLFLVNLAGMQVPGLLHDTTAGAKLEEVIQMPELLELMRIPMEEKTASREIAMPGGKIYYVSVSPVLAEGRRVGKICILRDITHYKELDTLKSDFVATVSHDLRSPLTLMRGYATMLQMVGELNDQQKGYVKKMVGGVDNMTRLVNNLLDLGRIEAGIDLRVGRVSAVEIVEQVITLLQPQAVQKNIQLSFFSPDSPNVNVLADQALLQQALYNLVENAIKYTPMGGRVRVQLQIKTSSVVFEVNDTGIGIAPLDLPRLFEKFYRSGRREAYQQRGTGLGLAIVKSIAERHNGRVWVESQLGKGSTFYLEIPIRGRDETGSSGFVEKLP